MPPSDNLLPIRKEKPIREEEELSCRTSPYMACTIDKKKKWLISEKATNGKGKAERQHSGPNHSCIRTDPKHKIHRGLGLSHQTEHQVQAVQRHP